MCDTGRVGVPGRVLLSLASKGECLLWFLERGRVWHGGGSDCPLWPAGHLGWWEPCGGGAAPSAQQPGCVHGSHTVMKGNAIFRAPSLIGVRGASACSWACESPEERPWGLGTHLLPIPCLQGWGSLSVCPYPAELRPPQHILVHWL